MTNFPETITREQEAQIKANTIGKQIGIMTKMACGWREAAFTTGTSTDTFDVRISAKVLKANRRLVVTLELNDTYTVQLLKIPTMRAKDPSPKVIEEVTNVYCTELSEVVYGVCNK